MKTTIEEVSDIFAGMEKELKNTDISTDTQKEMLKNIKPLSVEGFTDRRK